MNSASDSAQSSAHEQLPTDSAPSDSASALHPHLLFLKTGGGSTVSEPKHQLSMQELQTLADSGSTSEGLLPVQTKKPSSTTNTAVVKQQFQGPLGIANVVLGTQDESFQRMASLFTPQNDKAIAKALQILDDTDDEPVSQALFSSLVQDPADDVLHAVSVPYDNPHQPSIELPLSSAKSHRQQSDRSLQVDPMKSLSWLDQGHLHDLSKTVSTAQKKALHDSSADAGDRPAPARSVLLSIALSVASTNTTVNGMKERALSAVL